MNSILRGHTEALETVQNLGGLTPLAGRETETLADADLVHLNGAIGSGQLHQDPPPHLAPGLLGWRLSVAPPRFRTVSEADDARRASEAGPAMVEEMSDRA